MQVVSPDDVSADVLARERETELAKEDLAAKPEAIRGKIVQGRLDKFRDTQARSNPPSSPRHSIHRHAWLHGLLVKLRHAPVVQFSTNGTTMLVTRSGGVATGAPAAAVHPQRGGQERGGRAQGARGVSW